MYLIDFKPTLLKDSYKLILNLKLGFACKVGQIRRSESTKTCAFCVFVCFFVSSLGSWGYWTSWWFQPLWKICSSNWIISPGRGENKIYLEPPPSGTSPTSLPVLPWILQKNLLPTSWLDPPPHYRTGPKGKPMGPSREGVQPGKMGQLPVKKIQVEYVGFPMSCHVSRKKK